MRTLRLARKYNLVSCLIILGFLTSCGSGGGGAVTSTTSSSTAGNSLVSVTVGGSGQSASLRAEKDTFLARAALWMNKAIRSDSAIAAIPAPVNSITFTISASDMTTITKDVSVAGQTSITETFSVPNGNARNFLVAAKDSAGTVLYKGSTTANLDGSAVTLDINMSAGDTAAPTVSSTSPANNATGVPVSAPIIVTFSKLLDSATITGTTFKMKSGSSTEVTGTISVSGLVVTFTPAANLSYNTVYTAFVTTGVKDLYGNALSADYLWSFTTQGLLQMGGGIQGSPLSLTGVVTTLAGTIGTSGTANGTGAAARFYYPDGITTDGTNLYVADSYNHTIRKVVISSGAVTTLAGTAGTSGTANGTGAAARFYYPYGITTDGTNLYVADTNNYTIRKIVISSGAVTTLAGTAGTSGTANGTGAAARFYYPDGITTDGTNLYVADTNNYTIRKIVISSGAVTTLAGTAGTSGTTDDTGTNARFYYPYGITTDGTYLYVTSMYNNNAIRKIVISSGAVTTLANTSTSSAKGITTDGTSLYVIDTHAVRNIK